MKAKKEILTAIKKIKKELLAAITECPKEISYLQVHFKALAKMLSSETQPSKAKIIKVVSPLAEVLEKDEELGEGLFDLLSPAARCSIMMLFLFHLLKSTEEEKPTKVPLDVEDGRDRNPYNNKPVGKLDITN